MNDESILLCDVPGCTAQLSMVPGVPRAEHGWGRIGVYSAEGLDQTPYDLCTSHYKALKMVVEGRLKRFGDDDMWWERQD